MMGSFVWGEDEPEKAETLSVKDSLTKRTLGKLTKMENSVLKDTNLVRKQHDKPPLTAVSHLNVVAQRHAINMAYQQKMMHTLDEKGVMDRLKDVSYEFRTYGENIAMGYLNSKAVVQGWMNSPGHRKNLLDEANLGYTQIGIGAYRDTKGRWYYCQVFARPKPGKTYE
ncbi:MAG: CAP domain-containing protein [Planctomycetaceae bacterium]|nr:CAP domain-containing protein [Planctomycetaceae bacterium]